MTGLDPKHTKIGCGLFAWTPYVRLRRADGTGNAAHLWQVLLMSAPAKLWIPGLWYGGLGTMADNARLTHQETYEALGVCIAQAMVEYDERTQVLRLTQLPDRCERAPNPSCLRGWWSRWQNVPDCSVRDRHLDLMVWLHLPFKASKRSAKEEMQRAWEETFGTAISASGSGFGSDQKLSTPSSDRASSALPPQLDLYATPSLRHREGDGVPHGPEEVEVKEKEEERGEVQERGPAPHAEPAAAVISAAEIWMAVKERFFARESAQNVAMWIDPLTASLSGNTCQLHAPNDYVRRWVKDKYAHDLQDDLRAVTGREIQVAI
jgi:hypothetical protein